MGTPRPSISPLSNAYESTKGSPSLLRGSAALEENGNTEVTRNDIFNNGDDSSSSLSDPEDDEREDELLATTHITNTSLRKDDIDSEAETERLEFTPKHSREAVEGIGKTPSKLANVKQIDEEHSEPASPIPQDAGAASSTSTMILGKKRKRSNTLESPLSSGESMDRDPPRKRSNEFKVENSENNSREDTTEVADDGRVARGRKPKSRHGARLVSEGDTVETVEVGDDVEPDAEEIAEIQAEEETVLDPEATDAFTLLAKQFSAFRDALYNERLSSIDAELAMLEQPQSTHPEYLRMIECVEQRRLKQDRETRAFHHYRSRATEQRILAERAQLHSQYVQTAREVREIVLDELGAEFYAIQRERRQGINYIAEDEHRNAYRYVDRRSDQLRQQAKYNHEVSILSGIAKYVGFPAAPEITGIEGDALDDDLRAMRLARPLTQPNSQHNRQVEPYRPPAVATPQLANSNLPRQNDIHAINAERSAHERYIESHAWARAPTHHPSLTSTPNISHTPEWAEHATGFRKASNTLPRTYLERNPGALTPTGTPFGVRSKPMLSQESYDGEQPREQHSLEQRHPGQPPQTSSPLHVPKQRMNGTENNGWRDYSGTSTIDAPLDNHREHETQGYEHATSVKRDFAREQPVPRTMVPPAESPSQYEPLHRTPITPLFPGEKTDMYRATGFRPLEGSFTAPAPSSMGGHVH